MKFNKGFTLIELLVVISIIGLLSSVVLASVNTARGKAIDSKLIQMAKQFTNLYALEQLQSNSYANLNILTWRASTVGGPSGTQLCNAGTTFAGNYASDALKICQEIVKEAESFNKEPTSANVWFGINTPNGTRDNTKDYSIIVYLPGESKRVGSSQFYCIGSSGRSSIGGNANWLAPGCTDNP